MKTAIRKFCRFALLISLPALMACQKVTFPMAEIQPPKNGPAYTVAPDETGAGVKTVP